MYMYMYEGSIKALIQEAVLLLATVSFFMGTF